MANNRNRSRSPTYADALKSPAPRPAPINTALARGGLGSGTSTANSVFSRQGSFGDASSGSVTTNATSLFAPSVWSPGPDTTQSATMPKKLSWEQALGQGTQTTGAVQKQKERVATPKIATPKSAVGLGLQLGGLSLDDSKLGGVKVTPSPTPRSGAAAPSPSSFRSSSPYKFQQHAITNARTSPFTATAADSNANTFPLMQYPFGTARDTADQPRVFPKTLHAPLHGSARASPAAYAENAAPVSAASKPMNGNQDTVTTKPAAEASAPKRADSHDLTSEEPSVYSALTPFNAEDVEDLEEKKPSIFEQESHSQSFVCLSRDYSAELELAFDDAKVAVKMLNSSHFKLPNGVSASICSACTRSR